MGLVTDMRPAATINIRSSMIKCHASNLHAVDDAVVMMVCLRVTGDDGEMMRIRHDISRYIGEANTSEKLAGVK